MDKILAKKPKNNSVQDVETLTGHLIATYEVMNTIMDCIGDKIIKNLCLKICFKKLRDISVRAALIHDIGKANEQFQELMWTNQIYKQALRHEWISGYIMIKEKKLNKWFFNDCDPLTINSVLFAIIGHHLQVDDLNVLNTRNGSKFASNMKLYLGHDDIKDLLKKIKTLLNLNEIPKIKNSSIDLFNDPLRELKDWILDIGANWWENANDKDKKIVAVVKALLIAADVAGSAIPKENIKLKKWVMEVTGRICKTEDIDNIINKVLDGKKPREFQKEIAESNNRVIFVKAGCGSGKTIAAYMWAKEKAKGKKLFFCYPTTGTATEGFKDYIIAGEMTANAALLHGREELDMEYLKSEKEFDGMDTILKNEALAAWDVPIVICTVDQVVNIVQNNRKPLFTFPSIANAAFVFDEIHLYDDRLFAGFLKFLQVFKGAPVLLMTATLSKGRQKSIKKILDKNEKLQIVDGPKEKEELKRYFIHGKEDKINWKLIKREYDKNGKILIVANTVNNCIEIANEANEKGIKPVVYHSRFKYEDRLKKHKEIIDGFNVKNNSFIAVTTQVCEVSLDISADMLISEFAPVPSIIQRLGRLNRREPEKGSKEAFIIKNKIIQPYEEDDYKVADKWLNNIVGKDVSQKDISNAFEKLMPIKEVENVKSAWLEEGPLAYYASGREGNNSALFILNEDKEKCKEKGRPVSKEIIRYSIPMNVNPEILKELKNWETVGFSIVVPEGKIKYSSERGAQWVKE
ncbi:MAG: CRISPR-associated helicase Cas3' [Candidatus Goldbacteria bacterium]|nr:CRISPR-associated helicase Cas3' [Candidatus Goldiibacteriota bacterium]